MSERKRLWRKKDTESVLEVLVHLDEYEYEKNSDGEKGRNRMKRVSLWYGITCGLFIAALGMVLTLDGLWFVGVPLLLVSPWLGWKIVLATLNTKAKITYEERSRRSKMQKLGGLPPDQMETYKLNQLVSPKSEMVALDKALDGALLEYESSQVEEEYIAYSNNSSLASSEADDTLDGSFTPWPGLYPSKSYLVARARIVHEMKHQSHIYNYDIAGRLDMGRNSVGKILRGETHADVYAECSVCNPCS